MMLALNVGNTHISLSVKEKGEGNIMNLPCSKTKEHFDSISITLMLKKTLSTSQLDSISVVLVASVVPALNKEIQKAFRKLMNLTPLFIQTAALDQLGFDYSKYDTAILGIDRLIASYYTKNGCLLPAIVIDFGTATTFNILDEKGAFIGGVIVPGIFLWIRSLSNNAALLPDNIELCETSSVVGTSTSECISIGVLHGMGILVDGFIKKFEQQVGATFKSVVATGGGAEYIMPYCEAITMINKDLVLMGLFSIYEDLCLSGMASNSFTEDQEEVI